MERISNILVALISLLLGIFFIMQSKRLGSVLVKSSNLLAESFNLKKDLGRGVEIFAQAFLILFGSMSILVAIRLIISFLKK